VLKARRERQPVAVDTSAWEERKRKRNRLSKLPAERDKVLAEIATAEARKQAIVDLFYSDGFYQRTSPADVAALEREQTELGPRIDALMARWEELELELETLAREETNVDAG
jgi:3-deoxy-D-arabino-heptulosonate 7-phosphate (DAHP) synthase